MTVAQKQSDDQRGSESAASPIAAETSERLEKASWAVDSLMNFGLPAGSAVILFVMAVFSMDAAYLGYAAIAAVWALLGWLLIVAPKRVAKGK
jgi:hypothetical protein